jgi:hypothetical protein
VAERFGNDPSDIAQIMVGWLLLGEGHRVYDFWSGKNDDEHEWTKAINPQSLDGLAEYVRDKRMGSATTTSSVMSSGGGSNDMDVVVPDDMG